MNKISFQYPDIEPQTIEELSRKLLEANSLLVKTNNQLEQIQAQKNEIIANLSHDLRAPITAIRSCVDYLQSVENLDAQTLNHTLEIINKRTSTLENLIQDMYYLTCIKDTSKEWTFENIDAATFFEEYFYDTIINNLYDHHNMQLDIETALSCSLSLDIQKFIRVLDNLFTNAVKYSNQGTTILLKVGASHDQKKLLISVIDQGIGIPEEDIPYIFQRTYTVSNARTPNSTTGSGLGLSIVKTIVERHHGTITCTSSAQQGSTFTITLPISH